MKPFNITMFSYAVVGILTEAVQCDLKDIERRVLSGNREIRVTGPSLPTFEEMCASGTRKFNDLPEDQQAIVRKQYQFGLETARNRMLSVVEEVRRWLDSVEVVFSETEVSLSKSRHSEMERVIVRVAFAPVPEK